MKMVFIVIEDTYENGRLINSFVHEVFTNEKKAEQYIYEKFEVTEHDLESIYETETGRIRINRRILR